MVHEVPSPSKTAIQANAVQSHCSKKTPLETFGGGLPTRTPKKKT
jgi:hypothetical protein